MHNREKDKLKVVPVEADAYPVPLSYPFSTFLCAGITVYSKRIQIRLTSFETW